jgi:hypothetical protein
VLSTFRAVEKIFFRFLDFVTRVTIGSLHRHHLLLSPEMVFPYDFVGQ